MWNEFKEFIARGNVLDLAVAVIIGAAFSKIVDSLVQDMIMPIIGVLVGGVNFERLSVTIGSVVISYGKFIQTMVDFLLIALAIFLIIKTFNRIRGGKKTYKVKPTTNVELLSEIRDILKRNEHSYQQKEEQTDSNSHEETVVRFRRKVD